MKKNLLFISISTIITVFSIQNLTAQWSLTGNAATNPSVNFLGTTDKKDLVFRTKNTERMRINSDGTIGIGFSSAPIALLELHNTNQINSMYVTNSSTNSNQFGFRISVNGVNSFAFRKAGEFVTSGAGSNNTAVQGQASSALANYGGDFIATDGANSNIAVSGYAGGPSGSTNYAVYGSIAGFSAGNDWAGYFNGRSYTKSLLIAPSDIAVSSSSIEAQTSLTNGVFVRSSNASGNGFLASYTGSVSSYFAVYAIAPSSGANEAGYFSGNVTVTGTFDNPSDERLKENIHPMDKVMDKIMQVSTNTYNFKKEYSIMNLPQTKQYGFIAQNLEKTFPELVHVVVDKSKGENNLFEYKAVNYLGMIPILTKALQEEHEQRLQTEKELAAIKERLESIESKLLQNTASSQSNFSVKTLLAKLDQNTPNPANQKSSINCYIPSNTKYSSIVIYSASGTQVKAFNNLAAGANHLDINANSLSGGVYTYVLLVDGKQIDSKQMIVTK